MRGESGRCPRRSVVIYAGGADGLELPPAQPAAGGWIHGGARTLHELAFAAAATGRRVELRGPVHADTFDELAAATKLRPSLPQDARRPTHEDVVFITEGDPDPLCAGRVVLSAARVVLLVLAPPGLFGWPYTAGWTAASPLVVDRASLARPEHFRAASALGLSLWTHMTRMRDVAEAAGVACRFIGNGSPLGVPDPVPKTVDVAWVRANRWAPWAAQVASTLAPGLVVDEIEEVEHNTLVSRLAAARVLLWPSRIEGHARIPTEARSVGCVPVALVHNEFATGLDTGAGAVVVDTLDAMGEAATALMQRPDELVALADRGRRSARRQLDWQAYVARVDDGLAAVEASAPVAAGAQACIGERLAAMFAAAEAGRARLEAAHGDLLERHALLDERHGELARQAERGTAREAEVRGRLSEVQRAHDAECRRLAGDLASLRARKAVRLALRVAALRPGRP